MMCRLKWERESTRTQYNHPLLGDDDGDVRGSADFTTWMIGTSE